ncbi:MAG: hypothetical protein HYZ14_12875 [Bacteroidetes bacterium]|nr:hypothetical protein [Bacteroidota bacterium]
MNYIPILLYLAALSSCGGDITLNQIVNNPVNFEKQEVSLTSENFALMIPSGWSWRNEEEDCDGENFLVMLNAASPADKDGYIDIISIQKIKSQSKSNDLQTEYDHLLNLSKTNPLGMKLVESGETEVLNYPAYFIHTKSDSGHYGAIENIGFIIKSDEEGYFYHLIAGASQTDDLFKNMSMMVECLMTFEFIVKE